MRTTLKKGIGRGAAVNGNGHAVLPPGALTPVTLYRQPPPPQRGVATRVGRFFAWVGVRRSRCVVVGVVGGFYLWAHESVALLRPTSAEGQQTQARLDPPKSRGDRARARLRPSRRRRQLSLALGHDDADPRRPGHEHDLDALVPARPPGPDLLPGQGRRRRRRQGTGRINSAYAYCGLGGALETVRHLTNLPINYLIPINFLGFIGGREQARRGLARRRPPLLQQERRHLRDRLREHQPAAGLPAPDGQAGARLRPLPAHRLRPLPARAAAAVRRGRASAGGQVARPLDRARDRQHGHAEPLHGGGARRARRQPERHQEVRLVRLQPPARPRLPGEDPGRRRAERALRRRRATSTTRCSSSSTPTSARPRSRPPRRSGASCRRASARSRRGR